MVRVFVNGPGDLGSIPGWVIPMTQKMVLDATLLNTQHYKVMIKVKWSNPGKGVAPSLSPWCSSYRKGSLHVTLDYGRQLYFYLSRFDILTLIVTLHSILEICTLRNTSDWCHVLWGIYFMYFFIDRTNSSISMRQIPQYRWYLRGKVTK